MVDDILVIIRQKGRLKAIEEEILTARIVNGIESMLYVFQTCIGAPQFTVPVLLIPSRLLRRGRSGLPRKGRDDTA
jgi:hypothetical protein